MLEKNSDGKEFIIVRSLSKEIFKIELQNVKILDRKNKI